MDFDPGFIDSVLERTGKGAEQAIPVLQAIQERYRYLPLDALEYVCAHSEITPSQLYGWPRFIRSFA
jgi:NADH:ubiquinone oxidoreductase subunit E